MMGKSREPWDNHTFTILEDVEFDPPVMAVCLPSDAWERAKKCVNACEGLNPGAFQELIEAANKVVDTCVGCSAEEIDLINRLDTAIAKVENK